MKSSWTTTGTALATTGPISASARSNSFSRRPASLVGRREEPSTPTQQIEGRSPMTQEQPTQLPPGSPENRGENYISDDGTPDPRGLSAGSAGIPRPAAAALEPAGIRRSEERSGGKEWVSTCRTRWSPETSKKKRQ